MERQRQGFPLNNERSELEHQRQGFPLNNERYEQSEHGALVTGFSWSNENVFELRNVLNEYIIFVIKLYMSYKYDSCVKYLTDKFTEDANNMGVYVGDEFCHDNARFICDEVVNLRKKLETLRTEEKIYETFLGDIQTRLKDTQISIHETESTLRSTLSKYFPENAI